MPHMTKRIFSCLLACLMIFEIFLSVPPPSHATGSPFDVKINQKDEKELGFKIFQGGDIHAQTAPSYPGFAFVRAYIEDKTNNDERVEIDHAELREVDTTNGMQKKVFFHIKRQRESGIDHSFPYSETASTGKPLNVVGVTDKIIFEYRNQQEVARLTIKNTIPRAMSSILVRNSPKSSAARQRCTSRSPFFEITCRSERPRVDKLFPMRQKSGISRRSTAPSGSLR